jgi:hypothetical protein
MIHVAWDWLQAHRALTTRHLIATDGLDVKRSAGVRVTDAGSEVEPSARPDRQRWRAPGCQT